MLHMSTHLLDCDKLNSGMNINLATLDQRNHSSNTASLCQLYPVTDASEVVKVPEEAITQKHSCGRVMFTGFLTAEPDPLPELALWTRWVLQPECWLSLPGKALRSTCDEAHLCQFSYLPAMAKRLPKLHCSKHTAFAWLVIWRHL